MEVIIVVNKIDRAKLFLPFDALKGLESAIKEKEEEEEIKKELTEESYIELENKLNRVEEGDRIKIKYYKNKKYVDISGVITKINYIKKRIQLDETYNISISDIIDIEL